MRIFGSPKPLINNNTSLKLGSAGTGNLFVDAIKNYFFIDYLRGGMQINLTVAIEFTGYNGLPNLPNSLHYLAQNANQYETAIKACRDIVSYYDYDQKIYSFWFWRKILWKSKC